MYVQWDYDLTEKGHPHGPPFPFSFFKPYVVAINLLPQHLIIILKINTFLIDISTLQLVHFSLQANMGSDR